MDVVAVDFETANGNASSACQLAAVVVRDSEIVEEHSWLIRPPRMYFAPRNIAVHGIRPKDVAEAPDMEQVWSELLPVIDGQVLVAHNARFDLGVLIGSLAAYDIACPDLEFTCTRLLARCGWPGRARYGLKPLADWLGVQFRHHDALEDARACAQIAAAVEKTHEQRDLPGLEQKLRITRGAYRHSHLSSPRMIGKRRGGAGQPRSRPPQHHRPLGLSRPQGKARRRGSDGRLDRRQQPTTTVRKEDRIAWSAAWTGHATKSGIGEQLRRRLPIDHRRANRLCGGLRNVAGCGQPSRLSIPGEHVCRNHPRGSSSCQSSRYPAVERASVSRPLAGWQGHRSLVIPFV
jgi:DNA polymerase III epsilon subunit-like protein